MSFLDIAGGQQRKTGHAHTHHILMVAENGQSLRRQRACRDMDDGRGQLTGNFVHIGDHQQQALGCGEGRR